MDYSSTTTTPFMSESMYSDAFALENMSYHMTSTSYRLFPISQNAQYEEVAAFTSHTNPSFASRGIVSVWDIDGEVAGSILDLFSVGNTAYYEEVWDGEERPDRPPTGQYTPVGDAVLPMLALACCYVVRIFIKNRKRLINK